MRDFLPADVRRREYVIGVIKEVYERYGFEPLETPAVENIETLMGKYGEEGNQLIFKILKRGVHESTGEADLALRYDLTVPLARVVAEYRDKLPKFFKRYQIQPVWRADRPARGRFREFYQCDVDVLGSRSMIVEAELIAAAAEALTKLGFDDFKIRLNHRQALTGVLASAGIPLGMHDAALVALDKLDKIGRDGVKKELFARGVVEKTADRLVEFVGNNEIGARGIDELRLILKLGEANGTASQIKVDPSLARGLSYYTGAIIEINVKDLSGSLGGGGRYDSLVGMFLGQEVPACGFSLGLERIIVVMTEREMFPTALVASPADLMVTVWSEDSITESIDLATELRREGLRVDLYPEPDKLGKQFKYASARRIPFVIISGDDERTRGEVALKDMRSGEQRIVRRESLAAEVRRAIN